MLIVLQKETKKVYTRTIHSKLGQGELVEQNIYKKTA